MWSKLRNLVSIIRLKILIYRVRKHINKTLLKSLSKSNKSGFKRRYRSEVMKLVRKLESDGLINVVRKVSEDELLIDVYYRQPIPVDNVVISGKIEV